MHRTLGLILGLTFLFPPAIGAETLPVGSGLAVQLPPLGEKWQVTTSAPEFLLEETAAHLGHELAAQGKHPAAEQIRQAAARRLEANEAFVCNPGSGACLVIDFSPLREGEEPPGKRAVAASARYAAEGLADEEGVENLRQKTGGAALPGAQHVSRIEATYRQHGQPRHFTGLVGFAEPSWFYLYYTDPLKDPADRPQMEEVLRTLAIRRQSNR